jgi:hypothetical protein
MQKQKKNDSEKSLAVGRDKLPLLSGRNFEKNLCKKNH